MDVVVVRLKPIGKAALSTGRVLVATHLIIGIPSTRFGGS
jgi:hypothetical protein